MIYKISIYRWRDFFNTRPKTVKDSIQVALTCPNQRKDTQITKRMSPKLHFFHITTTTGDNTLQASHKYRNIRVQQPSTIPVCLLCLSTTTDFDGPDLCTRDFEYSINRSLLESNMETDEYMGTKNSCWWFCLPGKSVSGSFCLEKPRD